MLCNLCFSILKPSPKNLTLTDNDSNINIIPVIDVHCIAIDNESEEKKY